MKVVILAGGYGTRISEESHLVPKPMIEIGGLPIIVHLMKYYYNYGFNEFVILLGYKQHIVKNYFNNYFINNSNIQIDTSTSNFKVIDTKAEKWKVSLIDTGLDTMTGGRLRKARKWVKF